MSSKPRIEWRAGSDRVSHVVLPGLRTLCGQRATVERLAWPPERQCLACSVRLGLEAPSPTT